MRRAHDPNLIRHLEHAGSEGARKQDEVAARAHREMAAFAGLACQLLERRGRETHQFDLVQCAGGEREQMPPDAVALGIPHLLDIAERNHRLDEAEGRAVVQPDALAELGEADALRIARDLLEQSESPLHRLDAAPFADWLAARKNVSIGTFAAPAFTRLGRPAPAGPPAAGAPRKTERGGPKCT